LSTGSLIGVNQGITTAFDLTALIGIYDTPIRLSRSLRRLPDRRAQ
jgi:hypothetical protein